MAISVYLYSGSGNPADVYLRPPSKPSNNVYLFASSGNPVDVYLRPPRQQAPTPASTFPAQFAGLRYFAGSVKELALVALADAPAGAQWRVWKAGTAYAVYLVDTTDPNASQIRVQTPSGTKAARLKT